MKYDWPGNVRELENVMERALILDEGGVIGAEDLPDKIRFGHSQKGSLIIDSPNMTLEELEKEYILKVLNYTRWQKKRSSELLGINASTLYRKLIATGIEKPGGGAGRAEHDDGAARLATSTRPDRPVAIRPAAGQRAAGKRTPHPAGWGRCTQAAERW